MAKIRTITRVGSDLIIAMDDDSLSFAVSSGSGLWLPVAGTGDGGGGGPVDPEPGTSAYAWPYNPSNSISDHFGARPDVGRWHEGIDFSGGTAISGGPVPSIGPGVIDSINAYGDAFGNHTTVRHAPFTDGIWSGMQLVMLYAHFVNYPANGVGSSVNRATTLGEIGNTGGSFGAHLHAEAHIVPVGGSLRFDYQNMVPAPPSDRTSVDFEILMSNYNAAGDVIYA